MRRIALSTGMLGALALLTACGDYGYREAAYGGSGPVWYDGYYGPYADGYWGSDGFYYRDASGRYQRDSGNHFRHQSFEGARNFQAGPAGRDRDHDGDRDHDRSDGY